MSGSNAVANVPSCVCLILFLTYFSHIFIGKRSLASKLRLDRWCIYLPPIQSKSNHRRRGREPHRHARARFARFDKQCGLMPPGGEPAAVILGACCECIVCHSKNNWIDYRPDVTDEHRASCRGGVDEQPGSRRVAPEASLRRAGPFLDLCR